MIDQKQLKIAKKQVATIAAYQAVFSGPDGEKVLQDLMKAHYFLNSTFDGDTTKAIFREGERNVILRILSNLNIDVKAIQERIKLHAQDL